MDSLQVTGERAEFDPDFRLKRLRSMRRILGLPETSVSSGDAGCSVGIEIEMTWPQAFPELTKWDTMSIRPRDLPKNSDEYRRFCADYDCSERRLLPVLKQIEPYIPRVGRDAYWEFSFLPTHHANVLIGEVRALHEAQILHSSTNYALHLTVGGNISNIDAHAVLLLLEQSGGTSVERLTEKIGWARKGSGGIKCRGPEKMVGPVQVGYEYRSLIATSPEQIEMVLSIAQSAYFLIENNPEEWALVRSEAFQFLRDKELPLKPWARPEDDRELWGRYAATLGTSGLSLSR